MNQPLNNQPTILIVDDNPAILDVASHMLLREGSYTPITALDGVEALHQFVIHHPRCVVIDINMPHLNGLQLLQGLRGDPDSADTPIVIMTALPQSDQNAPAQLLGTDEYLSKPFTIRALIAAIDNAMQVTPEQRRERLRILADGY